MAQSGFTPIQLYFSTTAAATPSAGNLANGELAVNITDGRLFYKDNGGTVRVLAGTGGSGVVAGSNTQVQFNNNGVFGASANMVFNGTRLTVADLADSGLTSGRVTYASTGGALVDSANLTFDGTNLTLGGGTANGVAYLNGSKVLTSGSALTFDGTNLNVGFGGAGKIQVGTASSATYQTGFYGSNGVDTDFQIRFKTGITEFGTGTSTPLAFSYGGSEQMRLTSTGLGIGTSSPAYKLHVERPSYGVTGYFYTNDGTGNPRLVIYGSSSGTTIQNTWSSGASNLIFANGGAIGAGTEVARFDVNGNLGIGTSSPTVRLQVEGAANSAALTLLRLNNSGTTGGGPGIASRISFTAGATALGYIQGSNFASGAAGLQFSGDGTNAQATLDSSGNLGLGVTPSAWAAPFGTGVFEFSGGAISGSASANVVRFNSNSFYNGSNYIYKTSAQAAAYVQSSGTHQWVIAPSGTAGNAISFTQAMTLDASGNLAIGHTSPSTRLDVVGSSQIRHQFTGAATGFSIGQYNSSGDASINNGANAPLLFATNNTERARIDSSGNLLVAKTTAGSVTSNGTELSSTGYVVFCRDSSSGFVEYVTNNNAAGTGLVEYRRQGTVVGSITTNGTSTSYVTSSDYRLKEDVQPMQGALAKVAALKPVTYTWKSTGETDQGFIAHELAEVCPGAVTGEKDAVDADGNPKYQGIDTSFLVATLTAAIQEQQAIIESLKARLDAANL